MILVTVGTQLPFDRLISTVDDLAPQFPQATFFAQVCKMRCRVNHIQTMAFISPPEFQAYFQSANLIISHAGIGTITTAGALGKPLIVFPRLAKLKEHRNDHQLATCQMLKEKCGLNVATNAVELLELLTAFFAGTLAMPAPLADTASPELIGSLSNFIESPKCL